MVVIIYYYYFPCVIVSLPRAHSSKGPNDSDGQGATPISLSDSFVNLDGRQKKTEPGGEALCLDPETGLELSRLIFLLGLGPAEEGGVSSGSWLQVPPTILSSDHGALCQR